MEVSIEQVVRNPYDSREDYGDLSGLKTSIKKHGLTQGFLVRKDSDRYELAFGGRRLQALRELGYKNVDINIKEIPDEEMSTLVLCENLHRKDLNAVELARAYRKGLDATKLQLQQFAKIIGVSEYTISNYLHILSLPERILEKQKRYSTAQLIALGRLNQRSTSVRTVLEDEINNREISGPILDQVIISCINVFDSGLPDKNKRNLCAEIITQDYSHLGPSQYGNIRVFADALLQRDVKRYKDLVIKTQSALMKARVKRSKTIKSVKDVIDINRELDEITTELRRVSLDVERVKKHDYYAGASKRTQWKFKIAVNKLVSGLENILKDEQEARK